MLQPLLSQTNPPVSQPQIGHGAPLTHLIAPTLVSPQLLVSIDEAWELKLWYLAPDTAPVEYLSLPLTEAVQQAQWCKQVPGRLWCLHPQGHLGYYDFDLVQHQAVFHAFSCLPALSHEHTEPLHHYSLGFCQYQDHFIILSNQGLWKSQPTPAASVSATLATANPIALTMSEKPAEKDLGQLLPQTLQAQISVTADSIVLGLLSSQQAQVLHVTRPEGAAKVTCQSIFCCDLETTATSDTAFLLSQQGQFLAVDRHVYLLHSTTAPTGKAVRHTYYGRPLAFFVATAATQPCLLWASGDILFTTALSDAGDILHHQEMQYTERYAAWPIFWSFAVADSRSNVPTFWVADHHRHNASAVIAPLFKESLLLTHSLVGEGGWIDSLRFTQSNRLYVGGGQKGTLCQLQLAQDDTAHTSPAAPVTLNHHYAAPPQAVETLWSISLPDRELLLTLSAGVLRCYDTRQSQAIEIPPPPAPWHKALENGALEQLSTLPKGWVAQFSHKGKVSLQHYDIANQQWRVLSQKLPERALLLAAVSEQELLMEHDNATGFFKLYFPHSQKWQDLPCDLEGFDQILWDEPQQLLAILFEGNIEVWQHRGPGQWHYSHQICQDSFFNGMAFSQHTPILFTLDNDGHFKHWSLRLEASQSSEQHAPETPKLVHHIPLSHWGPEAEDRVVSISEEGTWIALGDHDQPLRIWNGRTGQHNATVLACVNAEGSDTEIAIIESSDLT